MSGLAARLPLLRDPTSVAVPLGAVVAALVIGAAFAVSVPYGIAALLGIICFAVAVENLQLSLAAWFPLVFLEGLPAFNLAAKAGGLLIVGVWFVWFTRNRGHVGAVLRSQPGLWLALLALLLWVTLSILWAQDRSLLLADVWHWYAVAVLMLIVATTVSDQRVLRWMIYAFVAGAVLTVLQGIASGGLSTSAVETATEGRLEGGQGDPNFLAAGIAPAMILALAAFTGLRGSASRWWLMSALMILALGLAASESRGGALAALAAIVAAVVVFKNRRMETMAVLAVVIGIAAAWFSVSPSAWERVTDFDSGGSGRNELWQVAGRIVEDKPIAGVGLNNYQAVAADYVDQAGSLARLDLIVDRAQEVHNAYLQLLAETGIIGLALLLTVAVGSLRAAWRAADRFHALGDETAESLARGVVVALVALMAASLFISNGVDKRIWVLYGMGPALLMVSRRDEPAPEPPGGLLEDPLEGDSPPSQALARSDRRPVPLPLPPARMPAVPNESSAIPGPAVQQFLQFAASEMRRLQEEAELVQTRLSMSLAGATANSAGHVSEVAESLMARSSQMAEECARLSEIVDHVAATLRREEGESAHSG